MVSLAWDNEKTTMITCVSANSKSLQVPFSFSKCCSLACNSMNKYLLFNIFALPFSLPWTYKRLIQRYRCFPWLCRYSDAFLRTWSPLCTLSLCLAHAKQTQSPQLSIYRATLTPSWENGTWPVPSQLPHSEPAVFVCNHVRSAILSPNRSGAMYTSGIRALGHACVICKLNRPNQVNCNIQDLRVCVTRYLVPCSQRISNTGATPKLQGKIWYRNPRTDT